MTNEELLEEVLFNLADDLIKTEITLGDVVIHVSPKALYRVAGLLKTNMELSFDYLSQISGVDYLEQDREPRFEAVYELHSIKHGHSIRLRVHLDEENPTVPTVTSIWKGADFPERELFDMFGFNVTGHPNLKRLIMPEDWEGHPLLKDYPLTIEEVAFSHNPDHKSELIKTKSSQE